MNDIQSVKGQSMVAMAFEHPVSGLYEHFYGVSNLESAVDYWGQLGFEVDATGGLPATRARALYCVNADLESVRLRHRATAEQGLIRLMKWSNPVGEGLGFAPPLAVGSRWSGFYVKDILEIRDAYLDQASLLNEQWRVTEPSRLFIAEGKPSFFKPFVGIRETFVLGQYHRHAFLQRVKFDRPGFGTFVEDSPLGCSEATHGCD